MVALGWPAFRHLTEAGKRIYWFHLTDDEAQHTELIERLSQTGQYGEWSGPPFAPRLTTGPTVVLPASLLQRSLHLASAHAGRIVVLAYHFLLLALLISIARTWLAPRPFTRAGTVVIALAGAGIFHSVYGGLSETGYYLFGVLGEGAAAFFLIATLFSFSRSMFFLAGVAASLAVFSKPYMLTLLPALILAKFIQNFRTPKISVLSQIFSVLFGIAVPFLAWIWWQMMVMGFEPTLAWWRAYPQTMRETNGAGFPAQFSFSFLGLGMIEAWLEHCRGLLTIMKAKSVLAWMIGIGFIVSGALRFYKRSGFMIVAACFALAHGAWWFTLSPGAQARYFFPLAVLGWTGFTIAVLRFGKWSLSRLTGGHQARWVHGFQPHFGFTALVAIVMVGSFSWDIAETWKANRGRFDRCELCRQLVIQDFYRSVAPAKRPSVIFTTSTKADKELFLSAPYRYQAFDPLSPVRMPSGSWVSVGDFARPGATEFVREHCKKIFTPPARLEGFWNCSY